MEQREKLQELLEKMDVPILRRTINIANLTWLRRNLAIRNSDKEELPVALQLIKELEGAVQ